MHFMGTPVLSSLTYTSIWLQLIPLAEPLSYLPTSTFQRLATLSFFSNISLLLSDLIREASYENNEGIRSLGDIHLKILTKLICISNLNAESCSPSPSWTVLVKQWQSHNYLGAAAGHPHCLATLWRTTQNKIMRSCCHDLNTVQWGRKLSTSEKNIERQSTKSPLQSCVPCKMLPAQESRLLLSLPIHSP